MKLSPALIFSIFFGVALVTLVFALFQISNERSELEYELEMRVTKIADELSNNHKLIAGNYSVERKEAVLDSLADSFYLAGIAIFYKDDSVIVNKPAAHLLRLSADYIKQSVVTDKALGKYMEAGKKKYYEYVLPIIDQQSTLVLFSEAGYMSSIIRTIVYRNLLRWIFQVIIISFFSIVVIKWGIFSPINKIVNWIKAARTGETDELAGNPPAKFLAPLHKEIVNITREMQVARITAEEEARLRTKGEAIWTPERLKAEVGNLLLNRKMVVVSNREPYMHIHEGGTIRCIVPASGMITAMEPILNACGGLWIASGTGDADKETADKNGKLLVPPEEPKYTLRRLWQSREDEIHYYYGFSNEGLWPLCHIAHTRPVFRIEDWRYYKKVNEDFADAVLEETMNDEQPFILIQDYHFALLPEIIRKGKPDARIAIFWHIPWPNPESFGICPWQKEILQGMLGADLIGFHTQYHCNHFLETVTNVLESRVGWDNFSVKMAGHTTFVKPFPISIEFTMKDFDSKSPPAKSATELLREYGIPAKLMGIGVDRIDYTKGIIEKFLGIERFFEKYPSYKGKFTFVQIGAPTRTLIKNYSDTMHSVEKEAERINNRFKGKNWKPLLLLNRHHSHEEINPFYEAADLCIVSSLHDGMNLVAKEYVASKRDNSGVLILSRFTGASQELHAALVINPYDIEECADTIKRALEMKPDQQHQRMRKMRQAVLRNNIYNWASELLRTMAAIQT